MPGNGHQRVGRQSVEACVGEAKLYPQCGNLNEDAKRVESLCKNMAQAIVINAITINANLGCLAWQIHIALDLVIRWNMEFEVALSKALRLITHSPSSEG
jgi:mannose-1-phosphate guanylyltransferase